MKILVFDNYDSFTYNLVHYIQKHTTATVDVFKNDEIELEKVSEYDKIVLSPGPGLPKEAGRLLPLIKTYAATKSILGVCLGHQAVAEVFGAKLVNLSTVYHGVSSQVQILNNHSIFKGLPNKIEVGRYHSWVASTENFPEKLEIIAVDESNYIMAFQHTTYNVHCVQFHPESVLTPQGETIIKNWLSL